MSTANTECYRALTPLRRNYPLTIFPRPEVGPGRGGVRTGDPLAMDRTQGAREGPAARDDPIRHAQAGQLAERLAAGGRLRLGEGIEAALRAGDHDRRPLRRRFERGIGDAAHPPEAGEKQQQRSEEHTSELQSLMRISYAVFCLKKKKTN